MSVRLASSTTEVDLEIIERIDFSTSRNIQTFTFGNGDEELIDAGKSVDQIILNGVNYSVVHRGVFFPLTFPIEWPDDYDSKRDMNLINGMMDRMEVVTLSGMSNTNLNTDYLISDFSFKQGAGEGSIPLYRFSITLERKYDQLG